MQINKQTRGQGNRSDMPRLLGGNLCLDFANTIEARRGAHPQEMLSNYADLVAWGEHVGIVSLPEADALREHAAQQPTHAQTTFEHAIVVREALLRIFTAIAHQQAPEQADEEQLRHAYIDALAHARLHATDYGYVWQWRIEAHALDCVLWPVIQAAVDLLCSDILERIKECPGAGDCGWLFLDTSKNGTRRWCSMEGCGSRVKMRRQYARKTTTADQ